MQSLKKIHAWAQMQDPLCTEKRLTTSLKDLSLALTNHGRHGLFSFLSSLPISVYAI